MLIPKFWKGTYRGTYYDGSDMTDYIDFDPWSLIGCLVPMLVMIAVAVAIYLTAVGGR